MFESTGDYLAKKAQELGLARADTLNQVQAELDRLYPSQARAVSLNGGVLRIITPNASVASELRFISQRLKLTANAQSVQIMVRALTD